MFNFHCGVMSNHISSICNGCSGSVRWKECWGFVSTAALGDGNRILQGGKQSDCLAVMSMDSR